MPRAVFGTTVPITLWKFHTHTVGAMQNLGFVVTLVSSPGTELDRVSRETCSSAVSIRMTRGITPLADAAAFGRWLRVLRKIRPNLVIAGTPKCALLGMTASAVLRIDRRIYMCGGLRLEGESGWRRVLLATMERVAMRSATEVVVNSRSLYDQVVAARLVSAHKLRQTTPGSSHGVNSQHFAPRPYDFALGDDLGLDPDIPIVGFVGRLTHDKGVDTLIGAMHLLHDAGINLQLLIVGPQDETDSAHYVRKLENSSIPVACVGGVSDVRPYFSLMSLHILPSLREGFPNVVLEAAAMGVPTITTTATGCRDAVVDGQTGRLFGTRDAKELASIIASLLGDADERARLGSNARLWVSHNFVPSQIAHQILGPPIFSQGECAST